MSNPSRRESAKSKRSRKKTTPREHRFVDYNLSQHQKEDLRAMETAAEYPFESGVAALVNEGYKVSFSHYEKAHMYISSMTDKRSGSDYENATLSGRGSTLLNAWSSMCYRHINIADGDWTALEQQKSAGTSDFD